MHLVAHHDSHGGPLQPLHHKLQRRQLVPLHPMDAAHGAAVHGGLRRERVVGYSRGQGQLAGKQPMAF